MISRDVIMTNCQNKINTMSSNSSTIKSIFLSLSIAIVAAYYGSSFFGFFIKENDKNFAIAVTVIFSIIEALINVVFTLLLIRNFSIERGYIALYYYCDKVKGDNDKIDARFVGYRFVSLKKYREKNNNERIFIENKCRDYLSVVDGNNLNATGEELIKKYNESSRIFDTQYKKCFKSPSIYGFTIANGLALGCIIALLLTRLFC